MFISFGFCLFFKCYENSDFLEKLINDFIENNYIKQYDKIFLFDGLLDQKQILVLKDIYNDKIGKKIQTENFKNFFSYISKKFYYELVSVQDIDNLIENISLHLEIIDSNEFQKVLKSLTNLFLLIFLIDSKHVNKHDFDANILKNIFNLNYFILTVHYYKGVGGTESDFFIRDYNSGIDKIIKHLVISKTIKPLKMIDNFSKYEVNINKINYDNFIILIMMPHEGPVVRVQREPENDTKKIHTSTIGAMLLCMPVNKNIDNLINEFMSVKYLKFDIFRASGAGGQHVNKTSSAVRVTHTFFNISCISQDCRSQLLNRQTAVLRLKEKIYKDFSDIIKLIIDGHFMLLDRNMKSQTFNYKRNMIHFHNNSIKFNINIVIDHFKDTGYFRRVYYKFLSHF